MENDVRVNEKNQTGKDIWEVRKMSFLAINCCKLWLSTVLLILQFIKKIL